MPILATYGIDPIHFGVIICLNLAIGLLTPPIGAGLFIASSIADVKIEKLTKGKVRAKELRPDIDWLNSLNIKE